MKPNAPITRRLIRPALLLGAALGVAFGLLPGVSAQTGPQTNSPAVPTAYQSPVFHSGGAEDPLSAADLPLFSERLQGTPTGVGKDGATPTQIPSYLLGAYNPLFPPAAPGVYFPEHFADGSIYQWAAPFDYVSQAAQQVAVDDNAGTPAFTLSPATGSWNQQTTGTAAGTAINQEYYRLPPNINNASATWTLTATSGGSVSVYFHIPDNIADDQGNIEPRSSAVTYTIATTGANATFTTAIVSQTEANSSQFLAGPFQLAAGDTVTVTLARNNSYNQSTLQTNSQTGAYLIADQMLLQPTVGDVQSTPTAVNATSFPNDFLGFKYWGIYVPAGATTTTPQQTLTGTTTLTGQSAAAQNAPPDYTNNDPVNGARLFHYGDPNQVKDYTGAATSATTQQRPARLIRQVVYFGRSEPTFSSQARADNTNNQGGSTFAQTGTSTSVAEATATNGNYLDVKAAATSSAVSTWRLVAPTSNYYYLYAHLPALKIGDTRISDATYTLTSGTVTLTGTLNQAASTGDVLVPVGPIYAAAGATVTVTLSNKTAQAVTASTVVAADSVTLTTGSGHGAIYCVDGFNGEVIWRFETPSSTRGPSAAVFSAPAVKRIHVITPANPTGADKLVVIVGDNNGLVYCLDAVGNGDGTSNASSIDPATGAPIYLAQPLYGSAAPTQVDQNGYTPHVGTTNAYWIYRPDASLPKRLLQAATVAPEAPASVAVGAVRRAAPTAAATHLYDRDLPIPGAFGTASPNVYVDPSITDVTKNNAVVYLPNSNGVLYALDALGVPVVTNTTGADETGGDRFNNSVDMTTTEGAVPTPTTRWWFTLRGVAGVSGTGDSAAAFTSAPALYVGVTPPIAPATTSTYQPSVYVGSSSEEGDGSNVGRVYALDGLAGPSGNGGQTHPVPAQTDPTSPVTTPGTPNYNLTQRPQTTATDTAHWSFPDAYGTDAYGVGQSRDSRKSLNLGGPRPALGNITGSPVVFTNFNGALGETSVTRRTRIYFAANSGLEVPVGSANGTVAAARPDDTTTGRVWAVNLDGSVGSATKSGAVPNNGAVNDNNASVWAYPLANDPNNAGKDTVAEPQLPIGSFLNATPAIGFVQFPASITFTGGTYTPSDVVHPGGLLGQSVPMLYVATRGATDTALYALNIDGNGTQDTATTTTNTGKLIYRQVSPDGTIFQSSPVLIANATLGGGNGGAVFATSGNTLYDFSATPISNPFVTEAFPLIRENAAFVGFGPISSPALAAADVRDLTAPGLPTTYNGANVTDWVYVGDSTSGLCRGITPQDITDGGIPGELGGIVPPSVNPVSPVDLSVIPQTYLVDNAHAGSVSASDGLAVGAGTSLPVYEWGENIYIRIKNIVPPAVGAGGTAPVFVYDGSLTPTPAAPVTAYYAGGDITFQLSDTSAGSVTDSGTIPPIILAAPASLTTPLANGFYRRTDIDAVNTSSVVDTTAPGKGYIAAYTYHIGDGSQRLNTPGSRRRVLNVRQIVHVGTYDGAAFTPDPSGATVTLSGQVTNGNLISKLTTDANGKPTYAANFNLVQGVDQPTFGVLNPLGVRGGGVPLPLSPATTGSPAVPVGDDLGPFRGIVSPMASNAPTYDLEALANGNTVPLVAPASTGGGKRSPIARPAEDLSTTTPYTNTHIVVTSTPLIPHNGSGDNSDPTGAATPPQTTLAQTNLTTPNLNNGLSPNANFGTVDKPYALDIFDRSALGVAGQSLQIRMSATPNGGAGGGMAWVDNTILTAAGNTTGHDSVVNYLPWETRPLGVRAGPNTSADYPNIPAGNVTSTLYSGEGSSDLDAGNATPKPAVPGTGSDTTLSRTVYGNPVQVHITVPNHQPANQQVYVTNGGSYDGAGEKPPVDASGANYLGTKTYSFPMGYYSTRRLFVPNATGRYRPGAAFRTIRIYTGVPVDMSTSIDNPTTDVGVIPSALGVQTDAYQPANIPGLGLFAPINPNFYSFFQPVTVHNNGNVNLLNVHLDQRQYYNGVSHTLNLTSDSLDPLSFISSYDAAGITGPHANLTAAVPGLPYLLRSSLDTDMVAAFGRNPALAANTGALYPAATFHKPLPGSDNPSTLTVPDVPEDTSTGYSLPASANNRPAVNASGLAQVAAPPYVSLAVPFGTPVGTYSQTVRVFEGLDTTGYNTYNGSAYNPLYPPQYGKAIGGIGAPTASPDGVPNDAARDVYQYGLQPVSTTGTVVKGSVVEDRMTDGFTFGALPQIDLGLAGSVSNGNGGTTAQAVPDFGPAAFRDPTNGNLAIYWTSNRGGSFGISGRAVPFQQATQANTSGYFLPYSSTTSWWGNVDVSAVTGIAGVNSGLTVAQDPSNTTNAFAFFVNVQPNPNRYTLYAATINYTATGSIGKITNPVALTNDASQVKYGVKGLLTFKYVKGVLTPSTTFAFWTASTRGRTAIYYTAFGGQSNAATPLVLPVPAGLTSVADPNPVFMPPTSGPNGAAVGNSIEVTFSGTAPDGSVDLYNCRYLADPTGALVLQSFAAVREIMAPIGSGYQARDAAWDRAGQLNLFAIDTTTGKEYPLLYQTSGGVTSPLFKRAIVDKASGQLVLTSLPFPGAQSGTLTAYIDGAAGRVRFVPALPPTFRVEGLFVPQARRITGANADNRADTGPVSFLDQALKPNDSPNLNPVPADRRWYIWRKSSSGQAGAATLFYKTQRLTAYLPYPVDTTKSITFTLQDGSSPALDVLNINAQKNPTAQVYLPIISKAEGQSFTYKYTGTDGNMYSGPPPNTTDTVQWQDERQNSDKSVPPANATQGLQSADGYAVPINQPVNENNVAAFLDPYAGTMINGLVQPHKVWLFWNSTRNGTADLYMETIDPRFGP